MLLLCRHTPVGQALPTWQELPTFTLPSRPPTHAQEQKEKRQAELEGVGEVYWWDPARSNWCSRAAEDDAEEQGAAPVRGLAQQRCMAGSRAAEQGQAACIELSMPLHDAPSCPTCPPVPACQAVHAWDAHLLPLVETLRAAGYRPEPLEGAPALAAALAGTESDSEAEEWDEFGPVAAPPVDVDAEGRGR